MKHEKHDHQKIDTDHQEKKLSDKEKALLIASFILHQTQQQQKSTPSSIKDNINIATPWTTLLNFRNV